MCGIFAYLNYLTAVDRQTIADILTNGLKRLEYRGYDSAGKIILLFSLSLSYFTHIYPLEQKEEEPKNTCAIFVLRFSHTFRAIGNVLKEDTPFIIFRPGTLSHTGLA